VRKEHDRKLDELRKDLDKKFMWLIGLVVVFLVG